LDPTARERLWETRMSRKKCDLFKICALTGSDQLAVLDKIEGDNLSLEGALTALGLVGSLPLAEVTARRLRRTLSSVVNNPGLLELFSTHEVATVLKEFNLHNASITAAFAAVVSYYQNSRGRNEIEETSEERMVA
jgi:hypothetical protein